MIDSIQKEKARCKVYSACRDYLEGRTGLIEAVRKLSKRRVMRSAVSIIFLMALLSLATSLQAATEDKQLPASSSQINSDPAADVIIFRDSTD